VQYLIYGAVLAMIYGKKAPVDVPETRKMETVA